MFHDSSLLYIFTDSEHSNYTQLGQYEWSGYNDENESHIVCLKPRYEIIIFFVGDGDELFFLQKLKIEIVSPIWTFRGFGSYWIVCI